MAKIRVVLADDHPAVIATVRQVLDHYCEIVDAVEDGEQAIHSVVRFHPDVLVIDITMPVMDGFQAARRLHDLKSQTRVVFLTMHEDPDFVEAALCAGASGYVTKTRLSTDLLPAVREAVSGRVFVSQSTFSKP
jgi:DNA-binding NarL/FixJ family response regulator